jgi:hypothetical protein
MQRKGRPVRETRFIAQPGTVSASMTSAGPVRTTYRDAGLRMPAGSPAPRRRPGLRMQAATGARDPVVDWLGSAKARQHRNHWVALNAETGEFLGRADDLPDLRRWQAEGALIVFVDPPTRG